MTQSKKLRRSNEKMIAGVCSGIADYLDIDPTIARIGYILLSLISVAFPGVLAYIALWIIMPPPE